jgi:D-alanine-D-alanine ligase-like ATP-grasp enzyme
MFGYDFLLDESGGVWLLEVNSSPSMDKSNSVLEKLIGEMSKDYINTLLSC